MLIRPFSIPSQFVKALSCYAYNAIHCGMRTVFRHADDDAVTVQCKKIVLALKIIRSNIVIRNAQYLHPTQTLIEGITK